MKVPHLEALFTHPDFWGVTTASPVQRAACRIVDGLPLGELAACDDVRWMVGGEVALATLASGGTPPRQVSIYGAVRIGKSDLASCVAFRASQAIDLRHVRPHEVPRIPILALTVDTARVAFDHLVGRLQKPALRPLLVARSADAVVVRHPSGRDVEIKVVAGARAGGSLIARWNGGAIFDEKPRQLGSTDGAVINYPDALAAVEGRLLDGAQIIDLGSPWAPWGPAWEDVDQRWGKPTPQHVVLRMTGPMANPGWWTPKRMAELREKNPRAFATDCMGEFAESDAGVFRLEWIEAAEQLGADLALDTDWEAVERCQPIAVLDVASGKKDTFAHGLVRWVKRPGDTFMRRLDGEPMLRLDGSRVANPASTRPDRPPVFSLEKIGGIGGRFFETTSGDAIFDRLAKIWKSSGVRVVVGDQRESMMVKAAVERRGFRFVEIPWTAQSKVRGIEALQRWLTDRHFAIEKHERLRQELITFRQIVSPSGGFTFGARGSGSDDFVAICITACLAEIEGHVPQSPHRPRFVHAMGQNPLLQFG